MYYLATITQTVTGIINIPCGFLPAGARITVGSKGTSQTVNHLCIGAVDNSGFMSYSSTFSDSSSHQSYRNVDKMVSHYERVSGTVTEVNAAVFDSFYSTGAKFNVTKCNSAYQYMIELWS